MTLCRTNLTPERKCAPSLHRTSAPTAEVGAYLPPATPAKRIRSPDISYHFSPVKQDEESLHHRKPRSYLYHHRACVVRLPAPSRSPDVSGPTAKGGTKDARKLARAMEALSGGVSSSKNDNTPCRPDLSCALSSWSRIPAPPRAPRCLGPTDADGGAQGARWWTKDAGQCPVGG